MSNKDTEIGLLAQWKDVIEVYETFTTIHQVKMYSKIQKQNLENQIKELSTSDQTENK